MKWEKERNNKRGSVWKWWNRKWPEVVDEHFERRTRIRICVCVFVCLCMFFLFPVGFECLFQFAGNIWMLENLLLKWRQKRMFRRNVTRPLSGSLLIADVCKLDRPAIGSIQFSASISLCPWNSSTIFQTTKCLFLIQRRRAPSDDWDESQ